jgi:hypothetical protein
VIGRTLLAALWARWKALAHVIGNFQARVLLSILYFVLIPPFGVLVQVLMDPLELRRRPRESFWLPLARRNTSLVGARRQS